jgi:hypothetical protein
MAVPQDLSYLAEEMWKKKDTSRIISVSLVLQFLHPDGTTGFAVDPKGDTCTSERLAAASCRHLLFRVSACGMLLM